MTSYDFDYFVIGAGSGGVRSARIAAGHGARVAIAEDRDLGGTCVNVGCVPKKLLAYAAHVSHEIEDAAGYGWTIGRRGHDWARLIANKNSEIARLNGVYGRLLEGSGVRLIQGRARLIDAHTVAVNGDRYTAERILIATGGRPVLPDEPGAKEYGITSDDAFYLKDLPRRVIVAGGGYIAVEFAGIFNGLGSRVTQLYRGGMILRGFDDDIREALAEELVKTGIDLRFHTIVSRIEKAHDCLLAHLSDGTVLETDCVLYAIGREPNIDGLGLDAVGIATNARGAIQVDGDWQTNIPGLYAIGDVTDRMNLTPVAIAEGHALADALFAGKRRTVRYDTVATAVFSQPPVASVGMTEAVARAACAQTGGDVDVYLANFKPMKHTLSGRDERALMKLVVDAQSDRVLGVHMMGADAPEILQGFAVAMTCGATKADLDATIGIHPTAAEEFVTMRTKAPRPDPIQEAAD